MGITIIYLFQIKEGKQVMLVSWVLFVLVCVMLFLCNLFMSYDIYSYVLKPSYFMKKLCFCRVLNLIFSYIFRKIQICNMTLHKKCFAVFTCGIRIIFYYIMCLMVHNTNELYCIFVSCISKKCCFVREKNGVYRVLFMLVMHHNFHELHQL